MPRLKSTPIIHAFEPLSVLRKAHQLQISRKLERKSDMSDEMGKKKPQNSANVCTSEQQIA